MKRRLIYCLLLLAGGGVCWAGMKVDAKSYAEMDLSAYSTYEWSTDQEADSGHPLSAGSPLDRRLQEIARTVLAGSGLEPAVDGEPDLLIHCIAISKEVQDIVELVDAESEERLWAGWASDALPAVPDPEKVGKKAEKALKKILKRLP
jgi:hypothetical protein